ncbi:MAG: hypothetical protein ACAH83_09175 [Alphaproteobacteria bacterium]
MDKEQLVKELDKTENRKFDPIWAAEEDAIDSLEQAVNWYARWTGNTAQAEASGDSNRIASCKAMVEYWDERLVTVVGEIAKLQKDFDEAAAVHPLVAEFKQKDLSLMPQIHDVFAGLDDQQIRSGKAIYDAVLPLASKDPAQEPVKRDPLAKGNPFKRGPSV